LKPDARCFWTDTQANFLETWRHFVAGARSVDPAARVGGPEPVAGPESIKPGEAVPLMQAFIEFSAAQRIQPDFISYHLLLTQRAARRPELAGPRAHEGRVRCSAQTARLSCPSTTPASSSNRTIRSFDPRTTCRLDAAGEAPPEATYVP